MKSKLIQLGPLLADFRFAETLLFWQPVKGYKQIHLLSMTIDVKEDSEKQLHIFTFTLLMFQIVLGWRGFPWWRVKWNWN